MNKHTLNAQFTIICNNKELAIKMLDIMLRERFSQDLIAIEYKGAGWVETEQLSYEVEEREVV